MISTHNYRKPLLVSLPCLQSSSKENPPRAGLGHFSSLQVLSVPIALPVIWHLEWELLFNPFECHVLPYLRG